MTFHFLGPDPVEKQVVDALTRLAAGENPAEVETSQVEVKEEVGRRGRGGEIRPGSIRNERAARYLAGEMACLANTPRGGAIILGIADDGRRIGTELDVEWLRHRIWELTDRRLTVTGREVRLDGTRLLVLATPEAVEPIRFDGKVRWRVDDHCVEVDPTTWHAGKLQRSGVDWSAQPSGHRIEEASAAAIDLGRRYLEESGDARALDLASATDRDLLRRLNVADGEGRLTNAGALLFVGTPEVGIDFIRRDVYGGDSTNRVRSTRPLLMQVWEVEQACRAANRVVHVPKGFAQAQIWAIPPLAVREAIVNGVVHRDWHSPQPTTVEHVGDVVTVTSPGGFIGGIEPSNIISHPAMPRYRSLAEAMAALRLAEREGIGIDRMVRDMLAIGLQKPAISEIDGPYVRVSLIGGDPAIEVIDLLSRIDPPAVGRDVGSLLLIEHLSQKGWVDVASASPVIQLHPVETEAAIERLRSGQLDHGPVIVPLRGVSAGEPIAYRLSDDARMILGGRMASVAKAPRREEVILDWVRARGRVTSTQVADMLGVSVVHAGTLLTNLEEEGLLAPGRERKAGRGFFYVPADPTS